VKLLMLTATINNWSNCTMLCLKKGRIIGKNMTSWFSSTTTHTSTMVQNYLETLNWEVLPHPAYSPDLAPFDYHLFSSMDHVLAERHDSYEDVRKWLDEWFASKDEEFFWRGIHKLPERWEKCIVSEGKYFE